MPKDQSKRNRNEAVNAVYLVKYVRYTSPLQVFSGIAYYLCQNQRYMAVYGKELLDRNVLGGSTMLFLMRGFWILLIRVSRFC